MQTKVNKEEIPYIVGVDEDGNEILISRKHYAYGGEQEDGKIILAEHSTPSSYVRILTIDLEDLKEFRNLKVDKSLYDNKKFAEAVFEELRLQETLKD